MRAAASLLTLVAMLLAAIPERGAAQAGLLVRAGDQPGLSRLVLDLPPGTQWLMEQEARQVVLRFPATALDFDTTAVFPGRQASRVLNARSRAVATGTVVLLTLACDCSAEAFTLGPRKLIVDLRDAPPADRLDRQAAPPPRPSPDPEIAQAIVPETAQNRDPSVFAATPRDDPVAPKPATDALAPAAPDAALERPEGPRPAAAPAADRSPAVPADPAVASPLTAGVIPANEPAVPPGVPDPPEPNLTEIDTTALLAPEAALEIERARAALLERLAQAAEQGLVDLRPPDRPEPAAAEPMEDSESAEDTPPPPLGPGIDIRTARQAEPSRTEVPPDPRCLPDSALALADWGLAGPPAAQIARARAELIGEFDRLDTVALTQLVRLYIHLGFGQEAEALLNGLAPDLPDAPLLADLARIVEGRPVASSSALLQPARCEGRAALWGFLARLDPETSAPAADMAPKAHDAILAALSELDGPLRRLIGPRAAHAYLALGRPDLAEAVLLRVASASGDPGDAYRLAEAAWLDASGRHDDAEAIWRTVIARNRPLAPQAMIALSESRRARGLAPPAGLAEDLAARAFAARRSADGVQLRLAEVETRAAEGDLAMALGLLRTEMAERPERMAELQAVAARTMARARPEETGAATFAAAILAYEDLLSREATGDPARLVLAGAMSELGLPNAALALLAPPLERAVPAARLVGAQAQLALAAPQEALALVADVDTPEAALLRAQAYALAGAHDRALASLPADAPQDLAAHYAFAAGVWDRTDALADPVDQVLAAYMAGRTPDEFADRLAAVPNDQSTAPADRPAAAPEALAQFLETPRLTEPISLDLARDAVEMARASRALLRARIDAPDG